MLGAIQVLREKALLSKIKSWRLYELTFRGKIDTWDYQWDFICRINNGLCIIPQKNLITNLGFDEGTHTTNYNKADRKRRQNIRTQQLTNHNL